MAGIYLLQRLFALAGQNYGCVRDYDFPKVVLLSFPFSEMLIPPVKEEQVRRELKGCLEQLSLNGAEVCAIACNTLHAFLDNEDKGRELIELPQIVIEHVYEEKPLVLCSSTSAQKQIYNSAYPDKRRQEEVDRIIDETLQGKSALQRLRSLIDGLQEKYLILGCTELSLYYADLQFANKVILDPLEMAASKLLEISFLNIRR
jgi:aspartate racemase